jgi:2-polyprenyl-6-methoxyphenol hydroxylase-like FAD-dependent oxidoreductase
VDRRYAVAIVGAGPAGCATAIALAAHGIEDVVVVDMAPQTSWRIGEAIPPAGRQALIELGMWEDFLADCHLSSAGSCASWGKPEVDYNDFLLDRQGKGWHLDRAAFDAMMAAAVSARGETLLRGLRLRAVEAREVRLSFEGKGGARLRIAADFLVDATGIAASAVRRLHVARNQIDCLAVVSTVLDLQAPDAVPSQTLLEACEHGWWYAAKLPKDRMIVALAVEPCQRQRFGKIDAWTAALRQTLHVGSWLERGKVKLVDGCKLATASAPSAILSRVVGERWLAVGDAASAYDPISAQGIVKALRDGAAAGEAIAGYFAGSGQAPLLAYQDGVFARFRNYLQLRRHLYQLERRWVQASFWQNRMLLG